MKQRLIGIRNHLIWLVVLFLVGSFFWRELEQNPVSTLGCYCVLPILFILIALASMARAIGREAERRG